MADTPLDTFLSFLKAMEKIDFETAMQYVDEDIEYINGAAPAVRGHAGVTGTLEPFFGALDENDCIIERTAASGDTVFAQRLDRHRKGDYWFELPVTAVCEVSDGKITYWREYFDMATIQADLVKIGLA